jgi:hypothetical protein
MSAPDYESAWWKRLAQPDSAQHEYTQQEAETTREVAQVMKIGCLVSNPPRRPLV